MPFWRYFQAFCGFIRIPITFRYAIGLAGAECFDVRSLAGMSCLPEYQKVPNLS